MANVVLATCPTFADTIATLAGIRRDKVRIAPKGVDTALFRPSGTWPPRESVVGFFKGFRLVNGARYLIEAIPAVRESCPDVRFDFVGSGAAAGRLPAGGGAIRGPPTPSVGCRPSRTSACRR